MQAKRIVVNESNDGVAGTTKASIVVPTSPAEEVNFHNIWVSVSVEPQDAGANCQGTWVLFFMSDSTVGDPTWTDGALNTGSANAKIIACGVFSASNESTYNYTTQIKTSRNVPAGGRLVLTSTVTGITAGLASNRVMLCAHTVRK